MAGMSSVAMSVRSDRACRMGGRVSRPRGRGSLARAASRDEDRGSWTRRWAEPGGWLSKRLAAATCQCVLNRMFEQAAILEARKTRRERRLGRKWRREGKVAGAGTLLSLLSGPDRADRVPHLWGEAAPFLPPGDGGAGHTCGPAVQPDGATFVYLSPLWTHLDPGPAAPCTQRPVRTSLWIALELPSSSLSRAPSPCTWSTALATCCPTLLRARHRYWA